MKQEFRVRIDDLHERGNVEYCLDTCNITYRTLKDTEEIVYIFESDWAFVKLLRIAVSYIDC